MWKVTGKNILFALAGVVVVGALISQYPPIKIRLEWKLETTRAYLHGMLQPIGPMPTAIPVTPVPATPSLTPTLTATSTPAPTQPLPTATQTPTPTPLPGEAALPIPAYEKQDPNNCGPATLTMYLRMYGWTGTQADIADLVKPVVDDKNVNVDELVYFVRTHVGWLTVDFRVGGDVSLMKSFLANGIPVMIEEGMKLDKAYWPNDDLWAGHYLLLTGYDDSQQEFKVQDSFYKDQTTSNYEKLDQNWRQFNRVFIMVYRPDQAATVQALLGSNWADMDASRKHALEIAGAESQANPKDAYAWFNLGSNLVYFDRNAEAAKAYDTARALGLPQRMLRYQFGPFFAYFQSYRTDDLLAVTEYSLKVTANSEETLLWHGWGLFRKGETNAAIEDWRKALKYHPGYSDAQYALGFVGASP